MTFWLAILIGTAPILLADEPAPATRWVTQQSWDDVELYAEFAPEISALKSATADVRQELEQLTGTINFNSRVQIMLFKDQNSYLAKVGSQLPAARKRKAIYYRNGNVHQIYAWNSRSLITDVRHEFTHACLHQHLAFLPLWLDEGLAEFLEEPADERARSRRSTGARWRARTGWKPSLTGLEKLPSAEDMTADDYRDSWAFVCFLMNHSEQSQTLLSSYLAEIHRGEAPGAFSLFAEADAPGLLNSANSYFRKFTIRLASNSRP